MPAIALALLEHAADVIVLTEFRRTTGGQIAGVLYDHGWEHQLWTDPPARTNGILVASRWPLEPRPTMIGIGEALERRWLETAVPDLGLSLGGVHIPCGGRASGRTDFFRELVDIARDRAAEPFVLIGDFNVGRHHLDEEGKSFSCTRYLRELEAAGYVDAWRTLHPEAREYTWYSHEGKGFRIDHALLSPPLAPRLAGAAYSHAEREAGLSDHSLLLLGLG